MMDRIIHTHLDNRLDLQEAASKKVEKLLSGISIDALLKNPQMELAIVAQDALKIVETDADAAAVEGLRFADEVKARVKAEKDITFIETENPNINKGEL